MTCCLLLPSPLGGKNFSEIALNNDDQPAQKDMFFTPDYSDEHFFDAFKTGPTTRPMGIRWRGDAEWLQKKSQRAVTLMPVLVQQQPNIQHHRQHLPSSSRSDDEPSLEEIELIDVLWRSDLSGISEKGSVEAQEESDLAALTHKSITGPLSQDEALRYEELSKGYFEDFYAGSTPSTCQSSLDFEGRCYSESSLPSCSNPVSPLQQQQQSKSSSHDLPTPTDAELDALFNDMLHKDSTLEHSLGFNQHPLMHNVSLGVPLTQSNLTEVMPQMSFGCETQCSVPSVGIVPATPSLPSAAFNGSHFWNNHTEGPLPPYLRTDGINNLTMAVQQMCHSEPVLAEIGAVSAYPSNPLHNVASLQVPYVTNGGLYDNFGSRRSLSISNESSIDSSSTSSSTSPRYNSEAENHSPNQSRFYGKLIPNPIEEQEKFYEKSRLSGSMSCSVLPRRRGRQSKDEQLAMSYRLPASAAHISDMSLPELQKMLRAEDLSEEQKALIRKIRRRGKNKVAARTCRQRRGEMKGVDEIGSPQPSGHLTTWNSQLEASRTLYRRQ